jgi:ComF family protein
MDSLAAFKDRVRTARDFCLDLLFPIQCLGCEQEKTWLCEDCFHAIPFQSTQCCPECGREEPVGRYCRTCYYGKHIKGILVAGSYRSHLLKKTIKTAKYQMVRDLTYPLGRFLALFLAGLRNRSGGPDSPAAFSFPEHTLLVPVPLHTRKYRWRGFNQSALMANTLSLESGYEIRTDLLKRHKQTVSQSKLTREKRLKNVSNCFTYTGPADLSHKNIILIDDITTTGATLNECAKTLKNSKAKEIWGLVAAKN